MILYKSIEKLGDAAAQSLSLYHPRQRCELSEMRVRRGFGINGGIYGKTRAGKGSRSSYLGGFFQRLFGFWHASQQCGA